MLSNRIPDGAERVFVKVSVEIVMKKGVRSGIQMEWMGVHERSLVRDSLRAMEIKYQIADFSSENADAEDSYSSPVQPSSCFISSIASGACSCGPIGSDSRHSQPNRARLCTSFGSS